MNFLGLFISVLSVSCVILSQIVMEYANHEIYEQEDKVHFILPLVPGIINVIIIGIFGQIYKRLAVKLAIGENH